MCVSKILIDAYIYIIYIYIYIACVRSFKHLLDLLLFWGILAHSQHQVALLMLLSLANAQRCGCRSQIYHTGMV